MDCSRRVRSCPVFCILKTVFLAVMTTFVLLFPLGDPNDVCRGTNKPMKQCVPLVCLCDIYVEAVKLFTKTKEISTIIAKKALDLLYEAKLKFYNVLNSLDSGDLYQSVCCKESEMGPSDEGRPRPACKCSRKCCKRQSVENKKINS